MARYHGTYRVADIGQDGYGGAMMWVPDRNQAPPEDTVYVDQVSAAMRRLPNDMQAVIIDAAMGREYEEVACRQNIPMGTVKSRTNRARLALAKLLQ